jgi:hypothetical protein
MMRHKHLTVSRATAPLSPEGAWSFSRTTSNQVGRAALESGAAVAVQGQTSVSSVVLRISGTSASGQTTPYF